MTRRVDHTDSFRRITRVKSEEFAREMKKRYEENNKECLNIVYHKKEDRYGLEEWFEGLNKEKTLMGKISWEEVREETGRNSIKEGGIYIRNWLEEKEEINKRIVKVNGEYIDTPFRTSYLK